MTARGFVVDGNVWSGDGEGEASGLKSECESPADGEPVEARSDGLRREISKRTGRSLVYGRKID